MSRRMEFDELISVLVAEHGKMKSGLAEVERAASEKDFASAARILRGLDALFRQHIADEEAQVLRLLIDAYGLKGADDAIVVFRQHRPIYDLMETVKKLASLPAAELASSENELRRLFDEHALAEETRVFPKALSAHKGREASTG
ncbi:MAG TPA: hemerythrin domain-containing protein [Nitrososphaerales archaeon]|nr:hemerythrin domain-containing protein [Nitrososphaerales archaeon]